MKRLLFLLLFLPVLARATTYIWPAGTNNILINRTNYPTLQAGDSVKIPPASGGNGYRSRTLAHLNAGHVPNPLDPTTYITIYWEPGAFITPSASTEQANSVDSLYGVHEVGMKMNDHADPLDFFYAMTGYIQYYWRDRDTCINCGGLWGSGPQTLSLTPYAGGADTAHLFWMDSISNSFFDSVGVAGTFDGLTTMWFGNQTTAKNNIWGRLGIANCTFSDNPSTHNPACFIHLQCCFGGTITNCLFRRLGAATGTYLGHAACIYENDSYVKVTNCHFEQNFGDCVRQQGSAGIAGFPLLNGMNYIAHCIDSFPIKYPFFEPQCAVATDSQYCPGLIPRAMGVITNITFAHPAMGVGHQYYNCSTLDAYAVTGTHDTARVYNCLQYGPTDTLATVCTSQGCNAFMTIPNGALTFVDTSNNIFSQTLTFPGTGLADSVLFIPIVNGLLYGNGIINGNIQSGVDNNGLPSPINGRMDIGSNMAPNGCNCTLYRRPSSYIP